MGDVVNLKTKEKHKCSDPYCETIVIGKKEYENTRSAVVAAKEDLFTLKMELKAMTLWERVFKWRY